MTIIQLHTHKQTLFLQTDAAIAAGDRGTVRLVIETDSEWAGYDLYAILWRDGQRDLAVSLPLCEAGCCLIPALMLSCAGTLHIALAGRDGDGRVKTSTTIRYHIQPGAPEGEGTVLADVASANATPDQVLSGVTFFAGEDQPQTGAIPTYDEGDILTDEIVDALTVAADFSAGDQTVTAEGMAPMRSVTVQKPDTLVGDYIAQGVRIAGVEGTLPTLPKVDEDDNGKTLSVIDGAWSAAKPTSPLPAVTEGDNGKTLSVIDGVWSAAKPTSPLPAVTEGDNGKTLSVIDGAWSAAKPTSPLPAVGTVDNGKVLSVVDGAWAASAPQGGAAEIPVYDLSEMGVPTIVVGGSAEYIEADTTALMNDLANGSIVMINRYDLGDDVPIPMQKITGAAISDGMCLITSVDDMMGELIVTMILVQEGLILVKAYYYANQVTDLIGAYMEEALGGDY